MNKVILIGNLTKDPELCTTNNGTPYSKFSIAVQREYKDDKGERQADYFYCTAWRTVAENVCKYCKKGNKICVSGSLTNRSYENKNGEKRTFMEIVAEAVEYLNSKSKADGDKQWNGLDIVEDDTPPFR